MSVVRAAVAKPGRDRITRYGDPSVGEENFVNQVQSQYNDFGQLTAQYQAHGGAVNTSTTPNVEYAYADGSANTVRPTSLTYPNGRVLTYSYGTTDGTNDAASRIEALIDDDSTPLAEYEYLGLGSIVEVDYPQPDLRYRLFDPGLSGDIYTSLDRFGRVIDCHWYDYGSSASAAQIQYGYDRASNRIWREDPVAAANGKRFDELYAYDGLHRLKEMQRGTLNGGKDAITNLQFEQCWSLDATGNWSGFRSDDDGTGWDLIQQRTANEVNEITGISETTGPSWATPAYDPAGNMTTIPQPSDPTGTYAATYDAWNRLTKLTDGEDTVQENQYDALRFRTVRKDYAGGTLDDTRHFFYTSDWQAVEERLDSETDPDRQSVWGLRYIDDLVLRDRPDLEERLYGLQDGNWNMIAIADDNGDVQERFAYSAYGVPYYLTTSFAAQALSPLGTDVLYCGYHIDIPSELYFVRYRSYNSHIGEWLTRDPLEYIDGMNMYCLYLPVIATDPFGLTNGAHRGMGIGWPKSCEEIFSIAHLNYAHDLVNHLRKKIHAFWSALGNQNFSPTHLKNILVECASLKRFVDLLNECCGPLLPEISDAMRAAKEHAEKILKLCNDPRNKGPSDPYPPPIIPIPWLGGKNPAQQEQHKPSTQQSTPKNNSAGRCAPSQGATPRNEPGAARPQHTAPRPSSPKPSVKEILNRAIRLPLFMFQLFDPTDPNQIARQPCRKPVVIS